MFVLKEIKDTIKIEPKDFGRPSEAALADEINRRYANKARIIRYGDGCNYVRVVMRLVVFRPFIGEVIQGTLKSCNAESIRISVGFFDDIIITSDHLPEGTKFDPTEQVFLWEEHSAYMDINQKVTFRVIDEKFQDLSPNTAPKAAEPNAEGVVETPATKSKVAPYTIYATMKDQGLGMSAWWYW